MGTIFPSRGFFKELQLALLIRIRIALGPMHFLYTLSLYSKDHVLWSSIVQTHIYKNLDQKLCKWGEYLVIIEAPDEYS